MRAQLKTKDGGGGNAVVEAVASAQSEHCVTGRTGVV